MRNSWVYICKKRKLRSSFNLWLAIKTSYVLFSFMAFKQSYDKDYKELETKIYYSYNKIKKHQYSINNIISFFFN